MKAPGLFSDPFREHVSGMVRGPLQLLGGRFRFESNSRQLLRLVDAAYRDLPRHRLSARVPSLRVGLLVIPGAPRRSRSGPATLATLSGAGLVGGVSASSNVVMVSPAARSALVVVCADMLRFPYHTRYELIEFAVFSLATRVQGLVSLHAACIGSAGRGLLLMGESGAGKSTLALQCLLQGFDFVSEDSTMVAPDTMLATGVANFLHVRPDSVRWVARARDAAAIRSSPVIVRRSGVRKFEVDLRRGSHRLAAAPLHLRAVVFLSTRSCAGGPLLHPLSAPELLRRLAAAQPYAACQPHWAAFCRHAARLGAFELRRGAHPLEAVEALRTLLRRPTR
jgi:hypothetical protein